MSRYKDTDIRYGGSAELKKSYGTTIYNSVPLRNDDMYFISTEGDRCDNLAHQFYNDAKLWWFIARVNNLTTNNIPAGTSLRIPTSTNNAKGF